MSPKTSKTAGFTLIEILIIAPAIILIVTAFIALIITITGDVLRTRGNNELVYTTQDALSRIDQDVSRAVEFKTASYTPTSPQGQGDNAAAFDVSTQPTTYLVLRTVTTDKNPLAEDRQLIYTMSGSTCSTTPYMMDTVYFTKVTNGVTSLWRRIIQGSTTDAGTPCTGTTPWQAPTCSPGFTNTTICKGDDTLILDYVTSLSVQYLAANGMPVANTGDLSTVRSASIGINVAKTIAGNSLTYQGVASSAISNASTVSSSTGGTGGSTVATFSYTGAQQTWTVPAGVTSVQIECWGAEGGTSASGKGGYAKGTLAVTPGQILYIYVGQAGALGAGSGLQFAPITFNGGGRGTTYNGTEGGGSGGGASDVRTSTALSTRVIVAGGGGGGYLYSGAGNPAGGDGGGASGNNGTNYPGYPNSAGYGGTQSAGGLGGSISTPASPGSLGAGGNSPTTNYGGGGGGGYYGGGGGDNTAAGGGSSYIGGVTSGTTTTGGRSGNGQVKITY